MARTLATLVALVGLGATPLAAAPLVFERLGPENGLPHNTVNSILQDRLGFLWLATDGGLSRYDGYEFVNYRIDSADGGGNVLMTVVEDADGGLWVGSEAGLWSFDRTTGSFTAAAVAGPVSAAGGYCEALLEDRRGRLWAGVGSRLVRRDKGENRFAPVPIAGGPFERIFRLVEDAHGEVWAIVGDREMLRLELRRIGADGATAAGPWRILERYHVSLAIDSGGRLWAGPLEAEAGEVVPLAEVPAVPILNDVLEEEDGRFWLGTADGLFRFDATNGVVTRQELPGAPSWLTGQIRSLALDRSGGLWVGTLGGLFHADPYRPRFRHWRHDPSDSASLSADAVSDITAGPDGRLWMGTFGGGISSVDPATGRARRFRSDPADPTTLPSDTVWSLAWGLDGLLWLSNGAVLDPRTGAVESRRPPVLRDGQLPWAATSKFVGPDGRVWLALRSGLYAYRPDTGDWEIHREIEIRQIASAGPSALWLGGTGELVLFDTENGAIERFSFVHPSGRHMEGVETLDLREHEGVVWIGTSAGLARFDPARASLELPVAPAELPGTVVYSIQPDGQNDLWLGTNQGLARFRPGAPEGARVRVYDPEDGVGNIEFNRHSRYRAPDGTIYMGGTSGVTIFHPDDFNENPLPPPVVITEVRALDRDGVRTIDPLGGSAVDLAPGTAEVRFSFSAINFTRADRNLYAYRLEGFDDDWRDGGLARSARYTNVPPGSYTFRVRAANNDGVWNEEGASLAVVALPTFWQTGWFRLLIAAAVIAALGLAYRLRVRRLIELERVRLGIAGDLHDELGSELSGIALASSRLAARDDLTEDDRARLDEIRSSAIQVMQGLRDIVWYVNPDHDSAGSLEVRMRSAARHLLDGIEHRFEVELPEGGVPVDMGTRRGLYLIFKELLTNAARHSVATLVRIRLAARDGELLLEVVDDGAGFDPGAASDGTGLSSVRRRAEKMGARIDLDTSPGAGCRAAVRVKMTRIRQSQRGSVRHNLPE